MWLRWRDKIDDVGEPILRLGYDGTLVGRNNFGVGRCTLELARALSSRSGSHEFVFYVQDGSAWPTATGPPGGCSIVVSPRLTHARGLRNLWQQLRLPQRASSQNLDVFHAPGYVLPEAMRVPAVVTVYDVLALSRPELCRPINRLHYRALLARSIRRARQVIAPSAAVRDQIVTLIGVSHDRITVVPPGVDSKFSRKCTPQELARVRERYSLDTPYTLVVGNREPKKNLSRLLAAFAKARAAGLEGELVMVGGSGWGDRPALDRPGVRWLGFVSDPDLVALYQMASELCFPSLEEGFGLPVLEAMASGTVVVASSVPSVRETDPAAVIAVDPLSVESITEGMLRARSSDDLRRDLREKGCHIAARFSWAEAARRTFEVYTEVAGNPSSGG